MVQRVRVPALKYYNTYVLHCGLGTKAKRFACTRRTVSEWQRLCTCWDYGSKRDRGGVHLCVDWTEVEYICVLIGQRWIH